MRDRIKTIRKNAGMTQQQFAEKLGVSRNTIATYETSVRVPIDAIIISMCREFGVRESGFVQEKAPCTGKPRRI